MKSFLFKCDKWFQKVPKKYVIFLATACTWIFMEFFGFFQCAKPSLVKTMLCCLGLILLVAWSLIYVKSTRDSNGKRNISDSLFSIVLVEFIIVQCVQHIGGYFYEHAYRHSTKITSGSFYFNDQKIDLTGFEILLNNQCKPLDLMQYTIPHCGKKTDVGDLCKLESEYLKYVRTYSNKKRESLFYDEVLDHLVIISNLKLELRDQKITFDQEPILVRRLPDVVYNRNGNTIFTFVQYENCRIPYAHDISFDVDSDWRCIYAPKEWSILGFDFKKSLKLIYDHENNFQGIYNLAKTVIED